MSAPLPALGAPAHTPDTVLERVVADLSLGVADLATCSAVDGFRELKLKIGGIAMTATRALRDLAELEAEGAFEVIAAEAERGEAQDRRRG